MWNVLWMTMVPDASACGGFFCNNDPIDQAAEDIVFAVDAEQNEVTMHVQIAFTGSAEDFAWIVPVGGVPEILVSTDQLFQTLRWSTQPWFELQSEEIGDCGYGGRGYYSAEDAAGSYSDSAPYVDSGTPGTVQVVSEQQVGPYQTAVLKAQNADGLLDWLQARKFVLPDSLSEVLAPYIAADGDTHFVALRLAKESDVGDLTPLALTYPGTRAAIPIQLTAIAATEDMRLRTYVLGNERAVPDSYFHVQVDDIVVDWFRGGNNWEQAITVAADEAGGHAFATDYSGPSNLLDGMLFREGQYDTDALASAPDAFAFFDRLVEQRFQGNETMLSLFRKHLPMPKGLVADGVDEQSFYNNLRYYKSWVDAIPFDAAAFAAEIETRIVAPLRDAQEMVDAHPHLTRLTSSISPVEMTIDPTFVFNGDMTQTVEAGRSAKVETYCGNGGGWFDSPRRLVLRDGRTYNLPSIDWFRERNLTEYEYLSDVQDNFALVIENTGSEGDAEVVYDGREDAQAAADLFNETNGITLVGPGCSGCQHGSSGGAVAGVLLLLGLARRRRS